MSTVTFSISQPMVSARAEQIAHKYAMKRDNTGRRWLWSVSVPNSGDHVYVEGGPNSEGFGGATLEFELENGEKIKLTGPWHGNAGSLFNHTGVDVRDKYLTWGIIGLKRDVNKKCYLSYDYDEVLHHDQDWVLGEFGRIEKMAQKIANERGCQVFYSSISKSGGTHSWVKPQEG